MAPRTVDSVKSMKVQDLRDELRALGLSATGVKADLVKRLEEALSSTANGEEGAAPAAEEVKEETKVTVEVDGDAPQAVVDAAADAAIEAAEEVVKEASAGEGAKEEVVEAAEEPAAEEVAAATEEPAEVEANGDAVETETAQAMDTTNDENVAPAKEEEAADATMEEEPPATGEGESSGHRLFVGCVPPKLTEEELKAPFAEVGAVKDVAILRDTLGISKGCAFVTYEELADAESAIATLDKKVKLPGATSNVEVRFARENTKVQPATEPNDQNMLFFARAPPKATEEVIKAEFAKHGEVKEVSLFHHTKVSGGLSKGCGFVYFENKEGATAAIDGIHDKVTLPGGFSPLTVKWADPNLTEKKRKAGEIEPRDPNANNTEIFFARIPRSTDEAALTEVFSQAGKVKSLVLFKVSKDSKDSKGCGIVTYESHDDAVNALATLHETHTFPPLEKSMVLKWVDHDLQEAKKRKLSGGFMGGPGFGGMQQPMVEEERPPQGCAPDAFKLYMVGVPKTWEVPQLKEALAPYGTVVEANIVRNKETKEPRGVAFAWMKTRSQGERAIREITKQGEGQQDPMKVSRAKPRGRVGMPMGMGGPGFGSPMSMGRGGGPSFVGRPGGFQPRMQGVGYNAVRSPASYGPRPVSSYGPRPASSYGPRAQSGYAARPQYQQGGGSYYPPSSGPSQYNYARPQSQQQGGGYNYQQQPQQQGGGYNYQQPAPAYQPAPTGYQAPAAQGYQAPAQSYQAPSQGYQAPYNPPAQQGYRPQADPQAASAYGTAQVYEPQPQQGTYGAAPQQYGAPEAQGGYNYQQPDPAPSAAAAASQYGAPAAYNPPQGYAAPTEGYNYGVGQR